jgi:hypothetical protein
MIRKTAFPYHVKGNMQRKTMFPFTLMAVRSPVFEKHGLSQGKGKKQTSRSASAAIPTRPSGSVNAKNTETAEIAER